MGLVSLANPLQHCAAVRLHAVKEAMPPEQHRVAMYLQRGRRLAKRVRRHHLGVKTEPFFFLAQPCQGGSRQGVEGALACPTAVALQPTGLTMQIKVVPWHREQQRVWPASWDSMTGSSFWCVSSASSRFLVRL